VCSKPRVPRSSENEFCCWSYGKPESIHIL
jgi:hypothetical protein